MQSSHRLCTASFRKTSAYHKSLLVTNSPTHTLAEIIVSFSVVLPALPWIMPIGYAIWFKNMPSSQQSMKCMRLLAYSAFKLAAVLTIGKKLGLQAQIPKTWFVHLKICAPILAGHAYLLLFSQPSGTAFARGAFSNITCNVLTPFTTDF